MRKQMKTERTKEKILAAAVEEFGTNGYAGASVNRICHAGIAKGLLYHNYVNKDALYLACVERCFHMLTEFLKETRIGVNLERYMQARIAFFSSHEKEAHIFFEALLQPPACLKGEIAKARREWDAFNRELYGSVLKNTRLRAGVTKEEALEYLQLMQEMFNGYFSSPAGGHFSFADTITAHEKGLAKMLDYMLYGIAERREEK